ncbi:MAG: cytochrome c3 family protein [Acidobacteriota bacterium]
MKTDRRKTRYRPLIATVASLLIFLGLLYGRSEHVVADIGGLPPETKAGFAEFSHNAKAHRLECSKCHKFPSDNWKKVRPETEAFPDITEYPKHDSCVSCHKQQFFRGAPPQICSICHVNPGPRDSTRRPYPNPREIFDLTPKGKTATSDFVIGFPHDKHVEIVSQVPERGVSFVNASFVRGDRRLAGEESCSVCHKTMKPQGDSKDEFVTPPPTTLGDTFWLKKGTFKTAPIGHTTCFTCHSADSGMTPGPSDCATCHKLRPPMPPSDFNLKLAASMKINDKVMMDAWRLRSSSGKFQHEFMAHVDMPCSTCHTVTTMKTDDPSTIKVPIASCATCHATAKADDGGAINYEIDARKKDPKFECIKCHTAFGKLAVPTSHTDAVDAAGK